ncbi:MAG: hypothetical protein IPJ61_09085 [Tessaracoccus sp.]|uniref:hypothetical protein n=1 Tax=Tessaracoccus sp. TaxID=1971211 RepID=UPI001ECB3A0D|nr:hypothetical protein [Tessaracoccus sp.]MBK7821215.1 hypothetical protein [Tessaracoccus sp.]
MRQRVIVYLATTVLLGGLGGLLWANVTPLASYTVLDSLAAFISERSQATIVAADATFTLITGVVGLIIGVVGWVMLFRRGWWVVGVPVIAALCASAVAWWVGTLVGSNSFATRMAEAAAGDVVQMDLQLRSLSALLVGPFAAITPIMLLSAFWPERRAATPADAPADGLGDR